MDSTRSPIESAPAPLSIRSRVITGGAVVLLVLLNLVGIAYYLWGASHAWAIPAERVAGIDSVTGEPFIWAMYVFPVWAAFLLVNGVWIAVALSRRQRRQFVLFGAVIAFWACAIVVDHWHH